MTITLSAYPVHPDVWIETLQGVKSYVPTRTVNGSEGKDLAHEVAVDMPLIH